MRCLSSYNTISDILPNSLVRNESSIFIPSTHQFTPHQLLSLFAQIVNCRQLRLRELVYWYYSGTDLSDIPSDIMREAVLKLEIVCLADCHLTSSQVTAIFTELSLSDDCKLRSLNLTRNNLSSVPTKTILAGISGIEDVVLNGCRLTEGQLTGIFYMVADREYSRMKKIDLQRNHNLRFISPDLLERAKQNEYVRIIFIN